MTVDIPHDCIWTLNADKNQRFPQSKHLLCSYNHLVHLDSVNQLIPNFQICIKMQFYQKPHD